MAVTLLKIPAFIFFKTSSEVYSLTPYSDCETSCSSVLPELAAKTSLFNSFLD